MTTATQQPPPNEKAALDQLILALAAGSPELVAKALAAFPDLIREAIGLLLHWTPALQLVRIVPSKLRYPVVAEMNRLNLIRRAGYLVSAVRRFSVAIRTSKRTERFAALAKAREREARYLQDHLKAVQNRAAAAEAVALQADHMALQDEPWPGLLGWYAVLDGRTSAECRRANGRNFDPKHIPRIGLPGAVHPHCRCRPGPPFATSKRVEKVRPDPSRAVAARGQAVSSQARAGWSVVRS